MKRIAVLLFVLVALGVWMVWTFRVSAGREALRLKDGRKMSFGEMLGDLKGVDIIFVGEDHGNPSHHETELRIISALHEAGVPVAIGLEMFRADDQGQLDLWTSGRLDPEAFIRLYYASWRFPWPLYRDILLYARDHGIPLIGLNIPEAVSGKIFMEGFGALSPSELVKLPPGIVCSVDPKYMDLIRRAYQTHDSTGKPFVRFCEAQMVWDKAMAWRVLEQRKKDPSVKVIVLAGTGHAWKHGIPTQVREASGYSFKVVLPGRTDLQRLSVIGSAEADYLLLK
jgi:uncharacterized iron-regulated protein